jgi:hypothetical protein
MYRSVRSDLEVGFEMLTTIEGIDAEEEADTTCHVGATNLVDLAGDEEMAMSLNIEGWTSSKWQEIEDFDFATIELP